MIQNNIINLQSLLYQSLINIEDVKAKSIEVLNYASNTACYPSIRIAEVLKLKEDNYTQKIIFTVNCLSNGKTSFDLINLTSQIEAVFENQSAILKHAQTKDISNNSILTIKSLYACGVDSVKIYQDLDFIFNLSLKIFFII
jgi:hypothetical protein